MGDCLSPGMTILTCAWMEREWMNTLTIRDKISFRAKRYMDDILLFSSHSHLWDRKRFISEFQRSECYWKPLRLEPSEPGKFLETSFFKEGNQVRFRLKNDNESASKVWRYHDYRSRLDYTTKRATIKCALRKANDMASDAEQLFISARAKCEEFLDLGYPSGILRHMCTRILYETENPTWREVRSYL